MKLDFTTVDWLQIVSMVAFYIWGRIIGYQDAKKKYRGY